MGNICRSPMADAVLRHLVREAGIARLVFACRDPSPKAGGGAAALAEEPDLLRLPKEGLHKSPERVLGTSLIA